jgi:glycosyltransferase involved in cell wall biosynthesis
VQYVPHAYGYKAMNLAFCLWLNRRRPSPVWTMFHEVAFPLARSQPLKHNFLGWVTRRMAATVARSAEQNFVSIPAWGELLSTLAPRSAPASWLPVPSNVSTSPPVEQVAAVRRRFAPDGQALVGHFGTYGQHIRPLLEAILPPLLEEDENRICLLAGRSGERFARELEQRQPFLAGRLAATGEMADDDLAAHLAACDLLLQPYPDGVSSRRGSLMAGLALGAPTVTTEGPLTEPLWRSSAALALAPAGDVPAFVELADHLLRNHDSRAQLGRRARDLYRSTFAVEQTIRRLRLATAEEGPAVEEGEC